MGEVVAIDAKPFPVRTVLLVDADPEVEKIFETAFKPGVVGGAACRRQFGGARRFGEARVRSDFDE